MLGMLGRITALIVSFALVVVPLSAQSPQSQTAHVVDDADLQNLIDRRVAEERDNRDAVLRVLSRSELSPYVEFAGIDLQQAGTAVSSLTGDELRELANEARDLEDSLVGGQSGRSVKIGAAIVAFVVAVLVIFLITRD